MAQIIDASIETTEIVCRDEDEALSVAAALGNYARHRLGTTRYATRREGCAVSTQLPLAEVEMALTRSHLPYEIDPAVTA